MMSQAIGAYYLGISDGANIVESGTAMVSCTKISGAHVVYTCNTCIHTCNTLAWYTSTVKRRVKTKRQRRIIGLHDHLPTRPPPLQGTAGVISGVYRRRELQQCLDYGPFTDALKSHLTKARFTLSDQ